MKESALGQTLQQIYQVYESKKNITAYVMYNDGPPGKMNYSWKHGHSKVIYLTWIAPELKTDLLVESWQRKGHEFFSNCSLPYHVYNVNLIKTPWNSSFSSYYDHSKRCVSKSYKDQWTCMGDLNYEPQQAKRSGGFICTQNQYICKAFRHLVDHYYDCRIS